MNPILRAIIAGQGFYYVVTGAWPLVSIRTFEIVTGPKTDDWLVQTVGVLVIAIGSALIACAWRRAASVEAAILGLTSAAALAAIEAIYVMSGTIRPIYLADTALEILFAGTWVVGWRSLAAAREKRSEG